MNKLKVVEEEVDESMYFLEMFLIISEKEHSKIKRLLKEADELLSIMVASINTMRKKKKKSKEWRNLEVRFAINYRNN